MEDIKERIDISSMKDIIKTSKSGETLGTIKYNEFRKLVQTLQKEEKEELADKLGLTMGTLMTSYLYSEKILPLKRQQILLEYFGFKNAEDFNERKTIVLNERLNETEKNVNIEKLVENENNDNKEDCKQVTEIIEEEPVKNINSDLSVEQSSDKLLESINSEFILPIVRSKLTKDDFLIAILLFGGYKGRYYSIEAISNFLKIEKEHIIYIKRKCLEEYKLAFDSMKSYNEKFIQSIRDDETKPLFYEKASND